MLKTILVALDHSEIAEQVIETLENLLLSKDSELILCHVLPTPESEMELPADRPQGESSTVTYFHQMEKQLQSYQEKLEVKTKIELVHGDPSEEIIRLANIYHADLVVIGSRGLTGVKRIVQGSVSSQVVEEAHCSVLVVKTQYECSLNYR